jgi:tRNA 2-thiouridine synthesizing protein A
MSTTATSLTNADTPAPAFTVDARGPSCPGPLVSLARALKPVEPGTVFELLATDPGSLSDVPSWATISGNELVSAETLEDDSYRYVIRKVG